MRTLKTRGATTFFVATGLALLALAATSGAANQRQADVDWTALTPAEACTVAIERATPYRVMRPAALQETTERLRVKGTAVGRDPLGTAIRVEFACSFERAGTAPDEMETIVYYL
jgi:hypothetical protein